MNRINRHRTAFTLVEMIAATAILATLTTATFALVRTANDAWRRHRDDTLQRAEATAALQHMVRRIRQATQVTDISASADMSGYLTLQMANGASAKWDHNGGAGQLLYGAATADNLLAEGVTQATFIGLTANGLVTTTEPAKIHAVRCLVSYSLNRPSGSMTESVSCMAWLRAW
jgi:prepilin-type N-terminal cleavage/methylation domain-containing protein